MNLRFFPSRRIAFYMARLFLVRSLAVLAGLVVILMTLDLLGNTGDILAHPGNGDAELWRYVGLRVPQLIARFLPFAVLLGALITLAGLNQNSEVIAMKAAGISAHQILAPLIVVGFLLALLNFAFNERILTRANAALTAWEAVDFGEVPRSTSVRPNVSLVQGDDLIFVRQVTGDGEDVQLFGIAIYDRTGGTLRRVLRAERGARANGGWRLEDVRLFSVDSGELRRMDQVAIGGDLTPEQFTLARVAPDEQDFAQLRGSIERLKSVNRATAGYEANLWHKLSGPLSSVLMPLLAGIAAFGLARSGQLFLRAVIGMALGFAYFVADNFALAMGDLGAYPPLLAAWGPFLLFLLLGETVLIRSEE